MRHRKGSGELYGGLARAGERDPARPARVEPAIEARILELRPGVEGILKIGRKLGIGTSVVQRVVAATSPVGLQTRA